MNGDTASTCLNVPHSHVADSIDLLIVLFTVHAAHFNVFDINGGRRRSSWMKIKQYQRETGSRITAQGKRQTWSALLQINASFPLLLEPPV